jgi:precorrin-6B methylase 2
MKAANKWKSQLEDWAIPEEILSAAPESPWGYPTEIFERRTEEVMRRKKSFSARKALEVMPIAGRVMDIGVGTGAASMPLTSKAFLIVGVDLSDERLQQFELFASKFGVQAKRIPGSWPQVVKRVTHADVVISHHLLYNIPDIVPFVQAMDDRALLRVVIEITSEHPLAWMNDLWLHFHGLERPSGPTAADAHAAIKEIGFPAEMHEEMTKPVPSGFEEKKDAIALVRRRLCLTPDKDEEIAEVLGDRLWMHDEGLYTAGPKEQSVATIWWDSN